LFCGCPALSREYDPWEKTPFRVVPGAVRCSEKVLQGGTWTKGRRQADARRRARGRACLLSSAVMQAFEAKPAPLSRDADGTIRVSGTRVSLETLVFAFDTGATAEEIVQQYPSLELSATYAVISYVLDNRADVDAYVSKRREDASALQGQIEGHSPPGGIRSRLLARSRPPAGR
jgi:uncharacterized protein (DUF433 family)